eukprot:7380823-Prymnesium_polylepis.2
MGRGRRVGEGMRRPRGGEGACAAPLTVRDPDEEARSVGGEEGLGRRDFGWSILLELRPLHHGDPRAGEGKLRQHEREHLELAEDGRQRAQVGFLALGAKDGRDDDAADCDQPTKALDRSEELLGAKPAGAREHSGGRDADASDGRAVV